MRPRCLLRMNRHRKKNVHNTSLLLLVRFSSQSTARIISMPHSPMKAKLFSIVVVGVLCACSSFARAAESIKLLSCQEAENLAIQKPRLKYPIEARRSKITGSGTVVVRVNTAGVVTSTTMGTTTGSPILDRAAVSGCKFWRFKPGRAFYFRMPITFTMAGANY